MRRSVRHALDEEENMRNETWRDGRLERVLTRFERLEVDMGFSGGRLTGWERRLQEAQAARYLCEVKAPG